MPQEAWKRLIIKTLQACKRSDQDLEFRGVGFRAFGLGDAEETYIRLMSSTAFLTPWTVVFHRQVPAGGGAGGSVCGVCTLGTLFNRCQHLDCCGFDIMGGLWWLIMHGRWWTKSAMLQLQFEFPESSDLDIPALPRRWSCPDISQWACLSE